MGHRNWSDTKLSVFTITRAVLTELYTQVPSLSRTHTHTHTILHALSQCAAFFLFTCCLVVIFVYFFKTTASTCIGLTADFSLLYMLTLTSKILEITN